jgi:hypothetical protein
MSTQIETRVIAARAYYGMPLVGADDPAYVSSGSSYSGGDTWIFCGNCGGGGSGSRDCDARIGLFLLALLSFVGAAIFGQITNHEFDKAKQHSEVQVVDREMQDGRQTERLERAQNIASRYSRYYVTQTVLGAAATASLILFGFICLAGMGANWNGVTAYNSAIVKGLKNTGLFAAGVAGLMVVRWVLWHALDAQLNSWDAKKIDPSLGK